MKSEAFLSNQEFASNKIRISARWFLSICCVYRPGQAHTGEAFSFQEFLFLFSKAYFPVLKEWF